MQMRSVKFNFLMNALSTALNFLYPLISFPYISRVLAPEGYGASEFALTVAQFFSLVALLGVNTYGIRECAKVRNNDVELAKVSQELFLITGIWTIIITAAFYASALVIPRFSENLGLFLIAGLLIPLTTIGYQWFMAASEQYAFMAVRNLFVKIIVIVTMFVLVRTESDVAIWVAISVGATGLSSIANLTYISKNFKFQEWRLLSYRRHIKPLLFFFTVVAATTVYTMLDGIMLGFMTSDVDVGYYNIAIKIKNVLIAIIAALAGVLIPRATYHLAQGDDSAYARIVNLSVHAALMYSFFAVTAVIAFATPIILLLAGDQYLESIPVLVAIAPAIIFISFTQITASEILTPKGQERALAIIYGAAAFIDIGLNCMLIPAYHALGAAIATSITECFVFVVQVIVVRKREPLSPYLIGCTKIIPWEFVAILVLIGARIFMGNSLAVALAATIVSVVLLVVGLYLSKEPLVLDLVTTISSRISRKKEIA